MHEIITLQLGQRSNYLATHFWNIQESYFTYSGQEESPIDHDVLFRAGLGAGGVETFTPRTIIYDLKGGFGTLRKLNALYDVQDEAGPIQALWDGSTRTQQQQPVQPSRYQTLLDEGLPTFQLHDRDVRYWSDFNRVFYHPRSSVQLNEYELNSQIMPFENWSAGEDLFRDLDKDFDLLDRDIRPFAEECDQMQGFQVLAGVDDAWGGFAARYVDNLRDEYGKTSIWAWCLEDGSRAPRQAQMQKSANTARSIRALAQQASACIRITAPPPDLPSYISLTSTSPWTTSALVCAAFESATLPTRLRADRGKNASLSLLEDVLNTNGKQNLYELQFGLDRCDVSVGGNNGFATNGSHDVRINNTDSYEATSEPTELDLNFSLGQAQSSTLSHTKRIFAQVQSDRHKQVFSNQASSGHADIEELRRRRLNEESVVERFDTLLSFPLLDTFPDTLFSQPYRGEGLDICTTLTTSSSIKEATVRLRNDTIRSIEMDEREVFYNDLTEIANGFNSGWDNGSDSGSDT